MAILALMQTPANAEGMPVNRCYGEACLYLPAPERPGGAKTGGPRRAIERARHGTGKSPSQLVGRYVVVVAVVSDRGEADAIVARILAIDPGLRPVVGSRLDGRSGFPVLVGRGDDVFETEKLLQRARVLPGATVPYKSDVGLYRPLR